MIVFVQIAAETTESVKKEKRKLKSSAWIQLVPLGPRPRH